MLQNRLPRLLDWHPGDPRPWVSLSHTLIDSGCPFCTFFQDMIGAEPDDQTGKFTPYLRIRQAFERLGGVGERHSLSRQVLIEVLTKNKSLPWGFIIKAADDEISLDGYLGTNPVIQGRIVTPMLDAALPRTWLEFCDLNHEEQCGKGDSAIDGLQLIDCEERRLVCVDDLDDVDRDTLRYITLSYANGLPEDDWREKDKILPTEMPQVVEDAIAVVKALRFRYLWVDMYCFATLDADRRRNQLDMMGEIYSRSLLTLVIAAGECADYGIPGVSFLGKNSCL